ncbi:MFS transporter [Rathayibacter festucae]|uniref:MFS transporter n=1 Tax=Rathayibacter festucae TaxID=110937 RepID=UPI002A6B693F|nr:MFS transporter [Rathayibacter festucae]MDY0914563.1 MFS transporter [Rathayibacter festucae]
MTSPVPAAPPAVRVGPVLTGLLLGLLVAMLSSSIISTSLPRVVADLGGSQATLTWIVTSALLATTVSTPVWGKLADVLGRRGLICAALVLFILGSTISGLAPDPSILIAGRVVQGAGAGGLLTLVQIVLADIISPRERGRYMGLFGAVMALGTIGGPLLGGVVTDAVGWRWNFYAAIPLAVASLIVVLITLRLPVRRGAVVIDYGGAALITAGVSGLLVWGSLGGQSFEWGSWISWCLLGGSVLILAAAVLVESRVREPIIPLGLFRQRGFVLTVLASLSVGVATYGTAVFLSQYLQLARGASPTESGLSVLPQVIAVTIASTVAGALISRTGRWKAWMVVGASSLTLGVLLLGTLSTSTPLPLLWAYLALIGIGIGCVMQNLVLMAEINVHPRDVGVASAGVAFFRSLGGTMGVTLLGAVLSWRAQAGVDGRRDDLEAAGIDPATVDLAQIGDIAGLAEPLRDIVQEAYARGVAEAFLFSAPLAVVTIVAIALLPARILSTKTRGERLVEWEESMADAGQR